MIILDYLLGPAVITRFLIRQQESQRCEDRQNVSVIRMLILKMGEGAGSKEWLVTGSW